MKRTFLLIALCSAFLFSCNEAEKSDDVVYNDYPDIEGVYHLEMTGRLLESGFTVGVGTPYYSDCRLCIYKKSDGLYSAAYYESADELSFPLKDEVFLTVTKNNDVRGIVPYFIHGASGAPIAYPALYKDIELIGYYNPNGVISGDYCGYARGGSGSMVAAPDALKAIGTFVMTKESDIPENFREQIKEEEGL